jgi:protein-disulfide isomerase
VRGFARLLLLGALGGAGMLGGSVLRSRSAGAEAAPTPSPVGRVPPDAGMSLGPGDGAPVLRVFGDYECPACRALEREAGDSLRALAARGAIRFVYHHVPLRAHRRGPRAAAAAYCAADGGAAWAAHHALYARAAEWAVGPDGDGRLLRVLAPLVADTASLRVCMNGDRAERRVSTDRAVAVGLRVHEVPTVFFGDRRLRIGSWQGLVRYVTARARAP